MQTFRAFLVVFATLFLASHARSAAVSENDDFRGQLKVLEKQVQTLLGKRAEDLRLIEENMRKKIFRVTELDEIKKSLLELRQEVSRMRSGATDEILPEITTEEKNARLTLDWLKNGVAELRTELKEVQAALNSTVILQDNGRVSSDLTLLKSDLKDVNERLESTGNKNVKYEAKLQMLQEEINSMRELNRATSTQCGRLKHQMKIFQEGLADGNSVKDIILERPSRHQRILKKHIIELEKTSKALTKENQHLRSALQKVQTDIKGLREKARREGSFDRINGNEIENYIKQNKIERVDDINPLNLTEQLKLNTKDIANLTKQISNFDRLHLSMLELLENVESIEFKVDNTFPEIRKEISKVEFQVNEVKSEVGQLKEDQTNLRNSVKAISVSVSNLQDKSSKDRKYIQDVDDTVQNLIRSNTLQQSKLHDHILKTESSTVEVNATKSAIHLVQELRTFENEYKNIINKLPYDCSEVSGPNGIYLISPGGGGPILASCNDGWTTVQKRHDGSVNFNQNWNAYANGFGSATGEHWLGNRNIHHLTQKNCSRLQINMKDIYGKYWQANYDDFRVLDYKNGFKLIVNKYNGNASDALDYQNNMEFSTVDNDRDISNTHCASNYEGGWWFSHCQHANLNGRYNLGLTWFDSSRNEWIAISYSEMRVKARDDCNVERTFE